MTCPTVSYHVQLTLSSPCLHRLVYRVSNHRLFTVSSPCLHHRVVSREGGLHDMSYHAQPCLTMSSSTTVSYHAQPCLIKSPSISYLY